MLHDVLDGYYVGIKYLPIILMFTIGKKRVSDEHLIKNFNVGVLTGRVGVGTLNPHQVPPPNTHPQLVAEGPPLHTKKIIIFPSPQCHHCLSR